ncbi:hypothetical protein N7462_005743 [Penicillium macrosclerotiorum]|uniref:uncharacterized protein n=1 Tax=Penicillium macrosclerotiorum TaxID=303699 RepID=UPI002547F690|nr:uncharacterized protein N7462_005743 [Penicillium macrosclerotiorum]KAJ5682578.1 hypothetical protein N7462_005743 [Penicillium macrosclerotiorum]
MSHTIDLAAKKKTMPDVSTFPFTVTEHIIDGQHIREYPDATSVSQDVPLKLVLKKYAPVDNPNPQPGDVTIIGAHGCGFPKEVYEPLWEDLLARSQQDGYRIRAIWIADVANLGASGVQNESNLGNDPSWFDHGRDLLYMINKFRDEMPRPIVGVGHSMGAGQLVLLSLLHPRLLTSLTLIEPVIAPDMFTGKGPLLSIVSLKRRDTWKSRSAAIEAARKAHKIWDERVLERWIRHAYRDLPTTSAQGDPVTLTSSKYQEVLQYLRPNPVGHKPTGQEDNLAVGPPPDPLLYADIIGPPHATSPFYRYEPILAWKLMKHVRPPVHYVLGSKSPISYPEARTNILNRTGTGVGGSGGVKAMRVKQTILKGTHQLPLEKVGETAASVGPWISQTVQRWKEDEARIAERWAQRPIDERLKSMVDWVPTLQAMIDPDPQRKNSKL